MEIVKERRKKKRYNWFNLLWNWLTTRFIGWDLSTLIFYSPAASTEKKEIS
jgi:hypothetical protein